MGRRVIFLSSNCTAPSSGLTTPTTMLNVVVLPAPFGPSRPTISAAATVSDTPLTTRLRRYCFTSLSGSRRLIAPAGKSFPRLLGRWTTRLKIESAFAWLAKGTWRDSRPHRRLRIQSLLFQTHRDVRRPHLEMCRGGFEHRIFAGQHQRFVLRRINGLD